ncbi:MAG: class I tRNA ligase family protein, partial [archaeon GB-1867-035]|nr:class I tRNA ligase family protein [Candidatus Culexmicrobium profundum]
QAIITVTENLDKLKTRTAFHEAFFGIWNYLRWYLRRVESINRDIILETIDIWLRLMAPFVPFICEELWEKTEHKPFISTAEWPKADKSKIDVKAVFREAYIRKTVEDIYEIIRVIKSKPSRIILYVAPEWKWKVYRDVASLIAKGVSSQGEVIREIMKRDYVKDKRKEALKVIRYAFEDLINLPVEERNLRASVEIDEMTLFKDAKSFFEREFNCQFLLFYADDPQRIDPKNRANLSMPLRPAIYIE